MDLWHNIQTQDGEVYLSTHFTKKGALVSQTEDILSWLDNCAEESREMWIRALNDWDMADNEFLLREDILNWREWTIDEIFKLRDIVIELTWDTCEVSWQFDRTQIQP